MHILQHAIAQAVQITLHMHMLTVMHMSLLILRTSQLFFSLFNYKYYFKSLFLSVKVCKMVLRLLMTVGIIRKYGNDNFLPDRLINNLISLRKDV